MGWDPVGGGGGEGGDVRKSVETSPNPKKTSRQMNKNAINFYAQASLRMTTLHTRVQSNRELYPLVLTLCLLACAA